ncbi:tRNA nucleotidyltransferase [Vibrio phage ValKK3]|uniref:tRNA nucleotidyltransferase n=1 Tax=Vibrio phage ValKK3 TaxID=1610855 RepID=A0A0D4DBD1_9CAUD|nr:tRNA nucleotidyltransferase [Vibrio phage ValKK3]AJT61121.1 tRNA nucleotidyltransferase [Vibrio phage ValKK3]
MKAKMNLMQKYIVGGAVRDSILKHVDGWSSFPKDIDYVVTGCTHEQMMSMYGEPIGVDFPVWLDKDNNEVALARVERSTGGKTTDFTFTTEGVTLEDDLSRRDLTINSMAIPDMTPNSLFMFGSTDDVIDPYGGLDDLKNKILRHTTEAFAEDPLRVLRVARFYARYYSMGFTVAEETVDLCKKMINDGMLENLPKERVWLETQKALSEKDAHMYFVFLSQIGFSPRPYAHEIHSLRHFRRMPFHCEDDQLMAKWAALNRRRRFGSYFGETKKFRKASEILMKLEYASVFDETIILILETIGAYKGHLPFQVALSQITDEVKRNVITEIIDLTRNVKVDVEPGPAYGEALTDERVNIAYKYLHSL